MTREELLESHIYCPEVIDDRIEAYLKLGFDVLLSANSVSCNDFTFVFDKQRKVSCLQGVSSSHS